MRASEQSIHQVWLHSLQDPEAKSTLVISSETGICEIDVDWRKTDKFTDIKYVVGYTENVVDTGQKYFMSLALYGAVRHTYTVMYYKWASSMPYVARYMYSL